MFPQNVVELLCLMVQHNTVTTPVSGTPRVEETLSRVLADFASSLGFDVSFHPTEVGIANNLLVQHQSKPDKPWLIFDAHLDTVSTAGMTIDPFSSDVIDDNLYGRGACDTKGPGAAALWALKLAAESDACEHNVAILFSANEEEGMAGAKAFAKQFPQQFPSGVVGIVVCEPTSCVPFIAHNGTARYRLQTFGNAAHSSHPVAGHSAISDLVFIISEIERNYIPHLTNTHPVTGKTEMSINIIRGGDSINIIPEHAECFIDRRLIPGESGNDELNNIKSFVDRINLARMYTKMSLDLLDSTPALPPSQDTRLLVMIQAALAKLKLPFEAKGGGFATNGGYYADLGTGVVVLGPGHMEQAHTKDEHISLEQLELGVKLYQSLMTGPGTA